MLLLCAAEVAGYDGLEEYSGGHQWVVFSLDPLLVNFCMTADFRPFGLPAPKLRWTDGEQPSSILHDDCYFPPGDGLATSRHTFLYPNDLPEAFTRHASFMIGEIGFGTGLNFFATLLEWTRTSPSGWLHFASCEGFPLSAPDIRRALRPWEELRQYVDAVLEQYPPPVRGFHPIVLPQYRATLTLLYGDATASLTELEGEFDAWFLDGFAPKRNPELWSQELFRQIARLSRPGSSLATFSSAGAVRRGLEDVGFEVQKIPGIGTKREHVRAIFRQRWPDAPGGDRFRPLIQSRGTTPSVTIVGAGIAGCSAAAALAARGCEVTILERRGAPAAQGSGNPFAVIVPYLSARGDLLGEFYLAAYLFSVRRFALLARERQSFDVPRQGVALLPRIGRDRRLFTDLDRLALPARIVQRKSATEARAVTGVRFNEDFLWFPEGAAFEPASACQAFLENERGTIRFLPHSEATRVERSAGTWKTFGESMLLSESEILVFASAQEVSRFSLCKFLPLEPIRGQIAGAFATERTRKLKAVICSDGYITPAVSGTHLIGSTYDRGITDSTPRPDQSEELLRRPSGWSPDLEFSPHPAFERASVRAASYDRLPFAGPLPLLTFEPDSPDRLREEFRRNPHFELDFQSDAYVLTGFGSRGMISAPYSAELLAAYVCGDTFPMTRTHSLAVHPGRALLRMWKQMGRPEHQVPRRQRKSDPTVPPAR